MIYKAFYDYKNTCNSLWYFLKYVVRAAGYCIFILVHYITFQSRPSKTGFQLWFEENRLEVIERHGDGEDDSAITIAAAKMFKQLPADEKKVGCFVFLYLYFNCLDINVNLTCIILISLKCLTANTPDISCEFTIH